MIFRNVIKKPDGIIVEGQVDSSSDFADFETYVKNSFSTSPDILESSIVYVANEGKFYAKNSSGEWTSGEDDEIASNSNSTLNTSSLKTNLLSDNKSVLFPDDETEVQTDDELLGRSESE